MKKYVLSDRVLSEKAATGEKSDILSVTVGYLCKFITVALSVFGMTYLLCNATGTDFVLSEFFIPFILCTACGAVTAFLLYCKTRYLLIWFASLAVLLFIYIQIYKFYGGDTFGELDALLTQLDNYNSKSYRETLTAEFTAKVERGVTFICGVISFFTAFALAFRPVMLIYVGVNGIFFALICYFNTFETNVGFMLAVSAFASAAVMKSVSNRFRGSVRLPFESLKKNIVFHSKSGLCGLLAFLMCVGLWAVPASVIDEDWRIRRLFPDLWSFADSISSGFSRIFGEGNSSPSVGFSVNLSDKGTEIGFASLAFEGNILGTVYSDSDSPVYLRTVTYENYSNGKWENGSEENYRPEQYPELFVRFLSALENNRTVKKRDVGVKLNGITAEVLPIASVHSSLGGIRKFGSDEPIQALNWNYYGGNCKVSDITDADLNYSTVSYEFDLSDTEAFQMLIHRFNASVSSTSSRNELAKEYLSYRDHVYGSCTDYKTENSRELVLLADRIKAENLKKGQPNSLAYINGVISDIEEYFDINCTYTSSPSVSGDYPTDPVLEFLFGKGEGYCVHYATGATALLRLCEIPARYAEGFYVSDFDKGDFGYGYKGEIKDSSSHAWVEYYVEGAGWQTFEATSGYSAGTVQTVTSDTESDVTTAEQTQTEPLTDTDRPETTETTVPNTTADNHSGTDKVTTQSSTDVTKESPSSPSDADVTSDMTDIAAGKSYTSAAAVTVICVLILSSVLFGYLYARKKKLDKKAAELESAMKKATSDTGAFVEKYMALTLELLSSVGLKPGRCELGQKFADRCGEIKEPVYNAVKVYQKLTFFGECDRDDCCILAHSYREIERYVTLNGQKTKILILRIKGRI